MISLSKKERCLNGRSKIVATLGPKTQDLDLLAEMICSGMDVARLNFSHGDHETHLQTIEHVRQASAQAGFPVAILQDLQGPRLRIGQVGPDTEIIEGQRLILDDRVTVGDASSVGISYAQHLSEELDAGDRILINDGRLEMIVRSVGPARIETEVVTGGPLKSRKGINLPDTLVSLPPLTPKDLKDLAFGIEHGVDYIALSFVGSAQDVLDLKNHIAAAGADTQVISKIERRSAVANIEAIVQASDGVMVARGDLALEIGAEKVPAVQKRIIALANAMARPVITATQMLESMIDNPRPTRAETSDVANAILDGTDAVMLSGETAVGDYPTEAIVHMSHIAQEIEDHLDYERLGERGQEHGSGLVTYAISGAAVQIAKEIGATAIIAVTTSGRTALRVAHRRPNTLLIGATRRESTHRRLCLAWGVQPLLIDNYETTDEMVQIAMKEALRQELVGAGDRVVITSGFPHGVSGTTNMVQVRRISE